MEEQGVENPDIPIEVALRFTYGQYDDSSVTISNGGLTLSAMRGTTGSARTFSIKWAEVVGASPAIVDPDLDAVRLVTRSEVADVSLITRELRTLVSSLRARGVQIDDPIDLRSGRSALETNEPLVLAAAYGLVFTAAVLLVALASARRTWSAADALLLLIALPAGVVALLERSFWQDAKHACHRPPNYGPVRPDRSRNIQIA
jgi:hypothetical protein